MNQKRIGFKTSHLPLVPFFKIFKEQIVKKQIKSLFVVLMLVCAPVMAKAADFKVAVVDLRQIMTESKELKAKQEAFQAELKPKIDEAKALDQGFRANVEKLQRNRDVMSEAERTKLEKEVQATQQELMALQNTINQEANTKQQQIMQQFGEKVESIIDKYAKDKKYDMVLIKEAAPFSSEKMDITKDILKLVEKG